MVEGQRQWLARTFVEYELLPRLLVLSSTAGGNGPPQSWNKFLSENECNLEHLLDEDMPASDELVTHLVRDAWHLVSELELVSQTGLTTAGRRIAHLQNSPYQISDVHAPYGRLSILPGFGEFPIRNHATLVSVLAQQLRTCYRGQDGLNITSLLQRGAALLAASDHIWAAYCPGLLLVELEALIHSACTDSTQAVQLCDDLVVNRDVAMHRYGMPSPDVTPMHNMVDHADAVAVFYFNDLELIQDSGPGLSVSRATAMLFTFCGLLQEAFPAGPVQCLAPLST